MGFFSELYKITRSAEKMYIGIDPGTASGAIFCVDQDKNILFWRGMKDMSEDDLYEFFKAVGMLSRRLPTEAIVEKVHCNGKNGSKANWSMGWSMSEIKAHLRWSQIPFDLVTPQSWQKAYTTQKSSAFASKTAWKGHLHDILLQKLPGSKIPKYVADAGLLAISKL